jgi:hypothetical protein
MRTRSFSDLAAGVIMRSLVVIGALLSGAGGSLSLP